MNGVRLKFTYGVSTGTLLVSHSRRNPGAWRKGVRVGLTVGCDPARTPALPMSFCPDPI